MFARVVTDGIGLFVLVVSASAGWEYASAGSWSDAAIAGGVVLLAIFGMGTGE